ncbi:hypothetical protein JTE90_028693 [Oedothorax gibbosus]|uniref:Uncharacterized protein n=1 Tax=Oedothorax gibbosus TaxID=931172 RepID=A0AAV6U011_9ARAC|nr:hypothetical protein JTE90_028693 [Oedothorax gibbosus]
MLTILYLIATASRAFFDCGKNNNDERKVFENENIVKGRQKNLHKGSDSEAKEAFVEEVIVEKENNGNKVSKIDENIRKNTKRVINRSKDELDVYESGKESNEIGRTHFNTEEDQDQVGISNQREEETDGKTSKEQPTKIKYPQITTSGHDNPFIILEIEEVNYLIKNLYEEKKMKHFQTTEFH